MTATEVGDFDRMTSAVALASALSELESRATMSAAESEE